MQAQLELFRQTLPKKPYCTDNLSFGLQIQYKIKAIERRYIEPNHPYRKHWLCYDVDRPGAGFDWQFLDCPAPNLSVINRENQHAHLLYGLGIPIHTNPQARDKPLRYAAAIDCALKDKLRADAGYSGLIVKNPLHRDWNVITWEDRLYDLSWLADYLDLERYWDKRRKLPDYGLGRNVNLFTRLRLWSYRAINRTTWVSFESWQAACLHKASQYNDFQVPLSLSEIKAISKSVSRWVWNHFTSDEYEAIMEARRRKSIAVRRANSEKKRQLLLALFDANVSIRDMAKQTGIPRSTVHNLLNPGVPFVVSDYRRSPSDLKASGN